MRYVLCVMYYPLPATHTRIRPYRFTDGGGSGRGSGVGVGSVD